MPVRVCRPWLDRRDACVKKLFMLGIAVVPIVSHLLNSKVTGEGETFNKLLAAQSEVKQAPLLAPFSPLSLAWPSCGKERSTETPGKSCPERKISRRDIADRRLRCDHSWSPVPRSIRSRDCCDSKLRMHHKLGTSQRATINMDWRLAKTPSSTSCRLCNLIALAR